MDEMTTIDRRNLLESRMEAARKKGAEACQEYGACLLEIRNDRLWADDFDTFADYCSLMWDISEETAQRWITAFGVGENLKEFGHCIQDLTITNAIALSKIGDKNAQSAVWSELQAAKVTPTAQMVETVASNHLPVYKLVGTMTQDEEREFIRTAESDTEEAIEYARFLKLKPRIQAVVRAVARIYEAFQPFRKRDAGLAEQVDELKRVAELMRGK